VSYSFAAALKKAAGIHSRLFDLDPDFKMADAYPRQNSNERVSAVG
jgi:hypothetical protein